MDTKRYFDFLSHIHPLSDECRAYIVQVAKEEFYIKNQIILSAGQVSDRLWFVQKGFAMQYTYKDIDKKPYRFWKEGDVMVDISSFFGKKSSNNYIEALESTSLLAINHEQTQSLFKLFPETRVLVRMIIDDYHTHAINKIVNLTTLSSEERFLRLLETCPLLLQKTSAEYIAAYLGISRKTLSRIQEKLNAGERINMISKNNLSDRNRQC